MKNLVQTVALAATVAAVAVGVWRDYAPTVVLRQAAVAYLGAYFLAGASWLACQAALQGARDPDPEPEPLVDPRRRHRQRRTSTPAPDRAQAAQAVGADAAPQEVNVS